VPHALKKSVEPPAPNRHPGGGAVSFYIAPKSRTSVTSLVRYPSFQNEAEFNWQDPAASLSKMLTFPSQWLGLRTSSRVRDSAALCQNYPRCHHNCKYSKHFPSTIATEHLASSFMRLRLKTRNFADIYEIICCPFFVDQEMNVEVIGHWHTQLLFSR
jgi:hypothetical protein